ncbi:MAG TPA: MBL fold metallo-hydrolase [Thermoanaerobaculia bacterium]
MKIRPTVLTILCVAGLASGSARAATYTVQKLAEGVWAAQPDQGANVGWFLLGDAVVAIDSGPDAASARMILDKIAETAGKPVRYLIITHAHGDHAGGAGAFAAAGAQVVCAENAATGVAAVLQRAGGSSRLPFVTISERMGFIGGTRRAAIYWLGAAHTAGDLVVLLPDEKILFSGDIALNGRLPYMQSPDMDSKNWEKILPRLAAVDVEKMVPGHGVIGPRQGIADTLAYVRKVNELAAQFVQTRIPDEIYPMKLRDPDNRIENVPVTEEHIANVRAVVRQEKERLEKALTPTPSAKKAPAKKPETR